MEDQMHKKVYLTSPRTEYILIISKNYWNGSGSDQIGRGEHSSHLLAIVQLSLKVLAWKKTVKKCILIKRKKTHSIFVLSTSPPLETTSIIRLADAATWKIFFLTFPKGIVWAAFFVSHQDSLSKSTLPKLNTCNYKDHRNIFICLS